MTFLTMPRVPRPLVFWEHRVYPGALDQLARVRADLTADLAGFDVTPDQAPPNPRPYVLTGDHD